MDLMAIAIDDLPAVVKQANDYLGLLKVRDALATGDMTLEVIKSQNHYDLVALFGIDAIRGILLPALDGFIQGKADELVTVGIDPTQTEGTK
jgi:hypothetical protein